MTFVQLFDSHFTMLQYGEFALRVIVASICGAFIGLERTRRFKEAGIRTHLIVCCAAALMIIVSKYGFADLTDNLGNMFSGTRGADPARVAAQVVSGVGFLGAGVIFHNGNSVKGLTTAAGLWATAGIGIAIGSGMYLLGIFTTVIIAIAQLALHKHNGSFDTISTNQLRFTVKNTDEFRTAIQEYISSQHAQVLESKIKFDEDGYASYNLTLRMNHEITIDELNFFLSSKGEVKSISCVSINN